jgi:recombination protein RecT
MPDNATALATTSSDKPLLILREQLQARAQELRMALPAHISEDKFQRTVITAVQQNPALLDCSRQSFILACMKAAQDGLLPDGRESAIIPFKENKKVDGQWQSRWVAVYMPMVYGLRKKILQSGEVVALEVGVVYAAEVDAGHFYYEVGKYPPLGHRPLLTLTADQATDAQIVGAYSIATMKDGTKSYEFMRRFEIDKVRECSQTGATRTKKGEARSPSGPWVDWFPEQAKKTVMRRHSKTLPMSGDVIIDVEGREIENGMGAAAVLSAPEKEPERIIDASGDTIDQETGEVIEEASTDEIDRANHAGLAEGETTIEEDLRRTSDQPETDEQTDTTPHPAEAKAEALLEQMGTAETIIDLDRIYDGAEADREAMSDEIRTVVDAAYARHTKRLKPAKEKEPAK